MKNNYLIKILKSTVFTVLFLVTLNAIAQTNSSDLEKKVDSLFEKFDTLNQPGMIVGISQDDSTILIKCYGSSDLEKKIAISSKTRFHIASLTKQFTAFAISQLEREGKLSYQDNILKYLPQLHDFGTVITIDQLLHHSSGLRSTNRLRLLQDDFYDALLTQKNALNLIYAQKELNFEPGSSFGYSNSGYILLATIVENISNLKFSEWLNKNVFEPLNMNETILGDDYSLIIPDRAIPYEKKEDGYAQTMGMKWIDYGATGIYSTLGDLMKWQVYLHEQNYMWVLEEASNSPYAMGLYVFKSKDGTIDQIFHTGDGAGYTSFMSYYPKEKIDVVLLSNLYGNEPIKLAETIIDFIRPINEKSIADYSNQIELPIEVLKKYEGSYDAKIFKAEFEIKDKQLYALNPQGSDLMVAVNETTFLIPNTPVEFEFDKAGQYVVLKMPGNDITCPKIIADTIMPSVNIAEYTGIYYSPELNVSYSFTIENNQLIADSPKHRRIVFDAITADKTESKDRYFRNVHFSRDENNIVNGLRVTDIDGRVRNLWFEKKE
ncbi:CubicO group peptidase (beta-lactamase class C family) [Ulvibacter sp. MAR_2010_11]|uniref:serine hydrolase domain-containing protein n=1 Tax=Ulvibacter sp. MAR_2010_11 TaxID=1250229 RepID=UPI000C2C1AE6|nr:serine hydrolase domain-containing protein [Ulvibacter sp. MAR_2010_11]PKA81980.1 CubicO group peptidase (beta-lactamase class C family) [Ulvibacter sp. MAR_2010_11]